MEIFKAFEFDLSTINWGKPKMFDNPSFVEYGHPLWPSYSYWMIGNDDIDNDEEDNEFSGPCVCDEPEPEYDGQCKLCGCMT